MTKTLVELEKNKLKKKLLDDSYTLWFGLWIHFLVTHFRKWWLFLLCTGMSPCWPYPILGHLLGSRWSIWIPRTSWNCWDMSVAWNWLTWGLGLGGWHGHQRRLTSSGCLGILIACPKRVWQDWVHRSRWFLSHWHWSGWYGWFSWDSQGYGGTLSI